MRRLAALSAVVVLAAGLAMAPMHGAAAQTAHDIEVRDQLIADQENLLNAYRCLFGVDVEAVRGGCENPATVEPGPAPASPTANDVEVRDRLIADQEALLNVYRCNHDVDTQLVPGGCPDAPMGDTGEPKAVQFAVSAGNAENTGQGSVVCALGLTHGFVSCYSNDRQWNDEAGGYENTFMSAPKPSGRFLTITSLTTGRVFCGLRADNTALCWRYLDSYGDQGQLSIGFETWENDAAPGPLSVLSLGDGNANVGQNSDITCGIKADGTAACWHDFAYSGESREAIQYPVPAGQFTSIAIGHWRGVCAAKADGELTCWKYDNFDQVPGSPNFNLEFFIVTPTGAGCYEDESLPDIDIYGYCGLLGWYSDYLYWFDDFRAFYGELR